MTQVIISCFLCKKEFLRDPAQIKSNHKRGRSNSYCSPQCVADSRNFTKELPCAYCNTLLLRQANELRKSKSGRAFCNRSCSAKFNNHNKTYGVRRSKFEVFLVKQIIAEFPTVIVQINDIATIGYELDIFIPKLRLALEVNGICHYQPIYGQDKFDRIQKNDCIKSNMCSKLNLDLIVIDISSFKHFNESWAYSECAKVFEIIERKLAGTGLEPVSSGYEPDKEANSSNPL